MVMKSDKRSQHPRSHPTAPDDALTDGSARRARNWRRIGIAILAAPILAGLPPILLDFPREAVAGWQALFIPVGLLISVVLVVALLRPGSRAYFSED